MTKTEKQSIKAIMWRLLRARKVVTYDELQELAGASRPYAQEWMADLVREGIVKKLSKGRYMLDESAYFKSKCINDGALKLMTNTPPGETKINSRQERPEYRIWAVINELKSFTFNDLFELNLACESIVRQYLTLLKRAGILSTESLNGKKKNQREGRYLKGYTMTDKAGPEAPLVGRCFYIFDPNTGEYHTTDLMLFESEMRPNEQETGVAEKANQGKAPA